MAENDNDMMILLIPQKHNRIIRFTVPILSFHLTLLIIAAIIVASSLLLTDYLLIQKADKEQRQLQKATMLQKLKFRELANQLETDREELEDLREFETKLRLISGLKDILSNTRVVGTGWNRFSTRNNDQSDRIPLLDRLNAFDQELKLRGISFFQLEAHLQEQKDRLARTPSIKPVQGYISSRFGIRIDPLTGKRKHHNGVDITGHMFSPIYSPADGVIVATMEERDFGLLLVIDHGYDTVTRYGHISKFEVTVGQYVKRGDLICRLGNEGRSSGPHLHYEVLVNDRYIDPMRYILD